jgi:membrane protease YdiL (CAAX protease family)
MQNDEVDFPPSHEGHLPDFPEREESLPEVLPAPTPPHPNLWWSILWSFGFLLVLFGTIFAVIFLVIIFKSVFTPKQRLSVEPNTIPQQFEPTSKDQSRDEVQQARLKAIISAVPSAMFLGELVSGIFAFVMIRLFVGPDWIRILALRRPSLGQLIFVLAGIPAMMILANLIHMGARELGVRSFQDPKELAEYFGGWSLGFAVLVIGVGPGLSEELWCRGFLGRGLVGNYGPWLGIVATSIIFGALHVDPAHAVAVAFMGLWLHFTYLICRSLWVPMLLHTLNNSLAVTQSTQIADSYPVLKKITSLLQTMEQAETSNPFLVLLGATCLLAAVALALYQARTLLVTRTEDLRPPWRPDFPGVEYPPAGTSTVVWRPWPGWQASGIVLAGLLIFALSIYLAPKPFIPK